MEAAAVDLHLHSSHSDGSDAPATVAERAAALGLRAIALTDHDTQSGVQEAADAAARLGLEFVPAVEVSCGLDTLEVHVLAYGVPPGDTPLETLLARMREVRSGRAREILAKLAANGIRIDFDDSVSAVTRMHLATALAEQGFVNVPQEAFDRYLNPGRPAWVPKENLPIAEGIEAIHASGGVAVIAHPALHKRLRAHLDILLGFPFDGLEAYHISHAASTTQELLDIAASKDLLVTGGSDCHGTIKRRSPEMGKVLTPYACYENLMERLARR
ncbi:MAG: PHP domain-containing protein [Candidatus Hydrogenedens sp.]|nr:PHP domain-containing protein [Candidatus Hydrogenedens sp.]